MGGIDLEGYNILVPAYPVLLAAAAEKAGVGELVELAGLPGGAGGPLPLVQEQFVAPAVPPALHHLGQVVLRSVAVDPVLGPVRNVNIGLGALGREVTGWEAVSLTDLVITILIKGEK